MAHKPSRDTDRAEVPAVSRDTGTEGPRDLHRSEGVSRSRQGSRSLGPEVPDTQEPGTQNHQRAALSIITGDQD